MDSSSSYEEQQIEAIVEVASIVSTTNQRQSGVYSPMAVADFGVGTSPRTIEFKDHCMHEE
ncbi:hypothetical protein [Paenibacillus massiliensis]|uniref:hypothetical protein n=1 Tax=Paenibacillus massiliensis TaxID=225917 RepID=UPI0018CBF299|nr:hypothetical protein [Paenibacillus massiliensis]